MPEFIAALDTVEAALVLRVTLDDFVRVSRLKNYLTGYESAFNPHVHMICPEHAPAIDAFFYERQRVIREYSFIGHIAVTRHRMLLPHYR